MLPSISHPGGALQSSIPYTMPLMAQLSGALSSKPQCLYRKRTPVTFRPKNELSIQLGATLGRVCGSTLSAAIIPLKDALCACSWMGPLQLGCAQDIPPGCFHVLLGTYQPWMGCLDTHSDLSHPVPISNWVVLVVKPASNLSSRSIVSLSIPLSSSTSSHISSSKALISFCELFFQTCAC